MGALKVNAAGLRAFRNGLARAADGDMMKRCCQELAEAVVEAAQGRTPVDTGRLRNGFSVELTESGAVVVNPVNYASFVELGHRTKGGGWAPAGRRAGLCWRLPRTRCACRRQRCSEV